MDKIKCYQICGELFTVLNVQNGLKFDILHNTLLVKKLNVRWDSGVESKNLRRNEGMKENNECWIQKCIKS